MLARKFDSTSMAGLSAEARKAVNAAFDAMSNWRTETVNNSEKNVAQVIEKMAAAARALGWPEQIVEATRDQMQSMTKMQIQVMDHMMDTWEEQIKSPNPSAMLSKLRSIPGFSAVGTPDAGGFPMSAFNPFQAYAQIFNPFQAYAQFIEQWQKAWASASGAWGKAGGSH
jgi:hypothetical protein